MTNKLMRPLALLIIITLIGVTTYLFFQNQKLQTEKAVNNREDSKIILSPSPSASAAAIPQITTKSTQTVIEEAINAKNHQSLAKYLSTPSVEVVLMSTECCGPVESNEVAGQLSYIEEGIPFNFDQNTALVKSLKNKNPQLEDAFVGLSKNQEHLIAFTIDANKVSKIEMAVTYKLYSQ